MRKKKCCITTVLSRVHSLHVVRVSMKVSNIFYPETSMYYLLCLFIYRSCNLHTMQMIILILLKSNFLPLVSCLLIHDLKNRLWSKWHAYFFYEPYRTNICIIRHVLIFFKLVLRELWLWNINQTLFWKSIIIGPTDLLLFHIRAWVSLKIKM